jgi:hypothetical protein
MDDTRDGAAGSLAQIAIVERRTRAALAYRRAGAFLILWGVLVAVGAGISQARPDQTEAIWYGVDAAGLLGTAAITLYRRRIGTFDRAGWRIIVGFLVLGAYGVAWSCLLAPAGHDRLAVFWATLMMLGYVIAGLWQGPLFAVLGLVGTAMSFAAFVFAGAWLHAWIGATYVVAFVLGGFWLYRHGVGER